MEEKNRINLFSAFKAQRARKRCKNISLYIYIYNFKIIPNPAPLAPLPPPPLTVRGTTFPRKIHEMTCSDYLLLASSFQVIHHLGSPDTAVSLLHIKCSINLREREERKKPGRPVGPV